MSTVKVLREQIFRVECLVSKCIYSEPQACLVIDPYRIYACPHCGYEEIPEQNWVCDGCDTEFGRLVKYFKIPAAPDIDEIMEAPEIYPNVRAVPLVCRIKRLCKDCFKDLGEGT